MQEGELLTYSQSKRMPTSESGESLVPVTKYDSLIFPKYEKEDMLSYTGGAIYVRDTVAKKLATVSASLVERGLRLRVVYGYRHPEVQGSYFNRRRDEIKAKQPLLSDEELDEVTHKFVAVPSVAGHPTGGAVDITVADATGKSVDMGTAIADFRNPEQIKTFAQGLTDTQSANRRLLHDLMIKEKFAPFYGEWWHFSYGDREWACFYEKSSSLYGPIDFKI